MSHVDEGTLHAYLDGEVTAGEREQVAAHLAECAACRTRLEEARALVARAQDLLALAAPPASVLRRARVWPRLRLPLVWAATIAIAFAAGRYVPETQGPAPAPPSAHSTARVLPPVSAAPPEVPTVAAQTEPRREVRPAERPGPAAAKAAPAPMAAGSSQGVTDAAAPSRARFDLDSAHALLGQAPVLLPDLPVRSVARADKGRGGVVLEQQLESGAIVRLYERQASALEESASPNGAARAPAGRARALAAAPAGMPPTQERLARYVGSLRIEIAGPLTPDSLTTLLDLVR